MAGAQTGLKLKILLWPGRAGLGRKKELRAWRPGRAEKYSHFTISTVETLVHDVQNTCTRTSTVQTIVQCTKHQKLIK